MDSNSQQKVISAGFTILRSDDQPNIRIKYKGPGLQDWKTFEKFETKAGRDRRLKDLLSKPKYISD
ncbi:MAG: hypothetical protein ACOYMF_05705 [Bacteroidales bacterium]